jgi:Transposase C of IS166 homeodomain
MQDPELVTQLKERLPETLFEKFNGSLSIDQERLKLAEYKVRVLEEKLRLVRIDKYGPGSEKLSDAQLELLDLEPGVSSAEVQAEGDRGQLKLPLKRVQKHPGRQELPADLRGWNSSLLVQRNNASAATVAEKLLRSVTRQLSNSMSNRLNTSCE